MPGLPRENPQEIERWVNALLKAGPEVVLKWGGDWFNGELDRVFAGGRMDRGAYEPGELAFILFDPPTSHRRDDGQKFAIEQEFNLSHDAFKRAGSADRIICLG